MIHQADFWIADLQKNIQFFHDKLDQRVWRQQSFMAFEKRVMLSCYIVRKLYESQQIDENHFKAKIPLYAYKNRGKVSSLLNTKDIIELYEVENPSTLTKPLSFVMNQIIHSFIFKLVFKAKNEIYGLIFNSDLSKDGALFFITLADFIKYLSPIANFYIGTTVMRVTENGDLEVVKD